MKNAHWANGTGEAGLARVMVDGATAREIMTTDCQTLLVTESALTGSKRLMAAGFGWLPVIDEGGRLQGVFRERDVVRLAAAERDLSEVSLSELASGDVGVDPALPFEDVEAAFHARGHALLPVTEGGKLVGVITWEDIAAQHEIARVLRDKATSLVRTVSPNDEMYAGWIGSYLMSGAAALRCIRAAIRTTGHAIPKRMLDMGCGHGRVMRFLAAAFPDAALTACDVNRDGVDFCAATFGAYPVYSSVDPAEVPLGEGAFDLIWCGSLFTHLDAPRWFAFLALLETALAPGGLLAFTTHSRNTRIDLRGMSMPEEEAVRMHNEYDEAGFAYGSYPGEADSGLTDFGLAIASPDWIRARIAALDGLRFVRHQRGAWLTPSQDLVVCVKA